MNILFYIEPLIFHNNPFYYGGWMKTDLTLANRLYGKDSKLGEFRFVLNKPLAQRCHMLGVPEEQIIVIDQCEIRRIFDKANMDIIADIHHKNYSPHQIEDLKALYQQRMGEYKPDIILSWSPAGFFENIFPDAVVLHKENGPISRLPYPYTTYYDPLGMYEHSMLSVFQESLKARAPSQQDQYFLNQLKNPYEKILLAKNPFEYLLANFKKRFRKLLLLPLQTSHTMYFDINGPFHTQGEYLFDVIEKTPEDIGIIVTSHDLGAQVGDRFHEEALHYYIHHQPNLIIDPHINAVHYPTQYLLPHVDACICVSSSVGIQSLLWNTPLITHGKSHLNPYATAENLEDFWDKDEKDYPSFEGALAWMFRYYYMLDTYGVSGRDWLVSFFENAIEKKRQGKLDLSFYYPIDDDQQLLKAYHHPDRVERRQDIPSFSGQFIQIVGSLYEGSLYTAADDAVPNIIANGSFIEEHGSKAPDNGYEIIPHWFLLGNHDVLHIGQKSLENAMILKDSERNLKQYLNLSVHRFFNIPIRLIQRYPNLKDFLGQHYTLTFWARGHLGNFFNIRMNSITKRGVESTKAAMVAPTENWKRYSFTVRIDDIPNYQPHEHDQFEFCIELTEADESFTIDITGFVFTKGKNILSVSEKELFVKQNNKSPMSKIEA